MIRTLLVIGALCFAPGLFAQNAVVITQQNAKFNAPGDELNWGFLDGTALQMPTRGENQVGLFADRHRRRRLYRRVYRAG